jgi:hypothetical protein
VIKKYRPIDWGENFKHGSWIIRKGVPYVPHTACTAPPVWNFLIRNRVLRMGFLQDVIASVLSHSYNKIQRDTLFLKFIFDKELYMFQTDILSIIRSFNTVYTAIGICHAS